MRFNAKLTWILEDMDDDLDRAAYKKGFETNYDDEEELPYEEVVSPDDLRGWKYVGIKPMTVFKATNTLGRVVPGFTSVDVEEAMSYLGGDHGGDFLVQIEIPRGRYEPISEPVVLMGHHSPILFEAGLRPVLRRGTEVVILIPWDQKYLGKIGDPGIFDD